MTHVGHVDRLHRRRHLGEHVTLDAGTGAVLNFDGFCEVDACVMESRDARVGAVSGLQRVRNPVLVARKVMEETDHVMLTGEGAQRFARVMGFPDHDPVTPERRADWFDKSNRIDEVLGARALKMRRFLKEHPEIADQLEARIREDAGVPGYPAFDPETGEILEPEAKATPKVPKAEPALAATKS